MDRLEALGSQLSQITLYDIKSMYNQAKNIVLNVSEMEAKVREATNEDPWGASSTLMQDIAQGTFNFQNFNEIMPCIYSRFLEKEAGQWRQIYKALQLLEYVIKHGSERVVDDARAHISTIKMLRNFHYVDDKAKDQGINVRTRAKEIVELLGDLDRVRAERRKAKANRNKYTGTGSETSSFTTGSSRYGGFGNEGAGGGYAGGDDEYYSGGTSSFRDDGSRFDEYDAGEYEGRSSRSAHSSSSSRVPTIPNSQASRNTPTSVSVPEAIPKETVVTGAPEMDLLDGFGADGSRAGVGPGSSKPLPTPSALVSLDDEFDDFQSAPPATAVVSVSSLTPALLVAEPTKNVSNMVGSTVTAAATTATGVQWSNPPLRTASYTPQTAASYNLNIPTGTTLSLSSEVVPAHQKPALSTDFDDLWNLGLHRGNTSTNPLTTATPNNGKSIKDLEQEKMEAGRWGGAGIPTNVATVPLAVQGKYAGPSDNDLLL